MTGTSYPGALRAKFEPKNSLTWVLIVNML
jgi:hypothetical protein